MLDDSSRTTSRKHSRRFLALAGVMTTAILALSGCAASVEKDFNSGFSVTAAASQVPAGDAERYDFVAADVAAIAELAGVERSDTSYDWLIKLTTPDNDQRAFVPLPDFLLPQSDGYSTDSLGWGAQNVDRFVSYSALPVTFTVVAGDLPELPNTLNEVSDGIVTDLDGEDLAVDLTRVGDAIDRMGRPTRLAQEGNLIALSSKTDLAESWITGDGGTLADDPAMKAIAEALDAYGALSAVISQPAVFSGQTILGPDATPAEAEAAFTEFDALVPPAPYDLVGLGWTVEDGSARWIATYHFLSEDGAKDGAQVLRAVWEQGATLSSKQRISTLATVSDVFVKDSTVAVVLTPTEGTPTSVLYQLLTRRELLFASR
ncbi:hypothetical protein [Microbacterium sp. NC79]|uniref:hypothetical protein n=1 Tax=Microbacterium sp. NC79 TaxID=2851009 RepID=UPI001C2C6400|nr:hypothetical protein [Microbacterium sp. NC79]MBV0895913.1 hypothetical protein [Microbacterium sp. NC79]